MSSAKTNSNVIKKDGKWTVDGRPRESLKPLTTLHPPNMPGKTVVTLLITLPPHGATPPHTHGGASVLGLMIKGKSLNQMNADPPGEYGAGEVWYESPGCHHSRSENTSESEEASFYAVITIDSDKYEEIGMGGLFVLDADKEENQGGKL